jgi:hypothetical protein
MTRLPTPQTLLRFGPAAVMTVLIPALSLLPARFFRHVEVPLPPVVGLDKIVHALMYAALTAAYLHTLPVHRRANLGTVLCVALFSALFGLVMELCQKGLTTSRSMDPIDELANATGALVCALLALAWARRVSINAKRKVPL